MAGFTAAKNIRTKQTSITPEFVYVDVEDLGESIYKGTLVARRTDGKVYAADPRENARWLGQAENTALTTGTNRLKITAGGPGLRIQTGPASTAAEASDTYHMLLCTSSDDDATLDAKDDGVIVYAVDGTSVTAHPKVPNSIPIGRLEVVITGAEGTAEAYIHTFDRVNAPGNWNPTGQFSAAPLELGGRTDFTIPDRRVVLNKVFQKEILAAAASAGAYTAAYDTDFVNVGSTGTPVLSTRGGSSLVTTTGDNDITAIVPHSVAEFSLFKSVTWSQALRLRCEWEFSIPSAAAIAIAIGMRITIDGSTAMVDRTTDADFAFLSFDTDVASETTFQVMHNTDGGTPVKTNTGVTATAETNYIFTVDIDEDGLHRYYLKAQGDRSSTLIYTSAAAASAATTLKPFAAVSTRTTAAKTLTVYRHLLAQDVV